MEKKRELKELLKNNFISLTFIIILICLGAVFAGNVIVKEGNIEVGGTGNFSGNQYINGFIGVGTQNPSYQLELKGTGSTTDGIFLNTTTYNNIPYPGATLNKVILNPRGFSFSTDSYNLTTPPSFGIGVAINRNEPAVVISNNASGQLALRLESGHIETQSSIFQDSKTYSSLYRGTFIGSNFNTNYYTQDNMGYSSWGIDMGGIDSLSYSGTADTFSIIRQAAGATHTARTRFFLITSGGNVGINVTTPAAQLANTATAANDGATGLTPTSFSWLANAAGYTAAISNTLEGTSANGLLVKTAEYDTTAYIMKLIAGGSSNYPRLVVRTDGNVGIGTATPTTQLNVVGNTNITSNISIGQLVQLQISALPLCSSSTEGIIGRNSTNIYYCNSTCWIGWGKTGC